jgi:hypothetical protein
MKQLAAAFSEKSSENTKRTQGRPRSHHRTQAEKLPSWLRQEACLRTTVDAIFSGVALQVVQIAGEDTQRTVWGCTCDDIMAGRGKFPKGWKTAAVSIGRYLEATGDVGEVVARIVADARGKGISFGEIAAHFRRLRLGDREGNADSLTQALARVLDEYRRRFPKTNGQQVRAALQNVLEAVQKLESG